MIRPLIFIVIFIFHSICFSYSQLSSRIFKSDDKTNTLIFTGEADHNQVTAGVSDNTYWFTTKKQYSVSLYLDEENIKTIKELIKKGDFETVIKDFKIHQDISFNKSPKAIVLKFSNEKEAIDIRKDFVENFIDDAINTDNPDIKLFLNYITHVRDTYHDGDEIIIFFADRTKIYINVCGKEMNAIQSDALSRALLRMWIGEDKLSGMKTGLLSEIENINI